MRVEALFKGTTTAAATTLTTLSLMTRMPATLWIRSFLFAIQLFEQVVFADLVDAHAEFATRHQLNVLQNHHIIQYFFIPAAVKCLHQLAQVDHGVFTFFGVFFLQRFFHQPLDILAIVLEADLRLGIGHLLGTLGENVSFGWIKWIVYIQVEVSNDEQVIPEPLGIFRRLAHGGIQLLDQFNQGIGQLGALGLVFYSADIGNDLLDIATIFFQDNQGSL